MDDGGRKRRANSAGGQRTAWRTRSDRELIAEMRTGASAAFDEFVARYAPLLHRRARRVDVAQWTREDCVAETLESTVVNLMPPDARHPTTMAGYLTRALHNRLVDAQLAQRSRRVAEQGAVDWTEPAMERAVTSASSRHAVETCTPVYDRAPRLRPGLKRLAAALIEPLSDEERLLIVWEGSLIPRRTIGEWLGVTREAAAKRIQRLRDRLREVAAGHMASLSPDERRDIDRFLGGRAALPRGPAVARASAGEPESPSRTGIGHAQPVREEHPDA